jgi:hypothetical protein
VLEALKKLDREKNRDERGFVVTAAAPWPTRTVRRWPAWAALGVATAGAIVAVVALRTSSTPAAPPAAAVAVPAPMVTTPPASVAAALVPPPAPTRVAPEPALPRGPAPAAVAPPVVAAAPTPDPGPRLQAISERDGQPIAIIDDHLVRVGDEVDGMRVLAIRGSEVDVEIRGRRTTLRF